MAEEVLEKWRKKHKAFTDKVNRTAARADHEMKKFEFDSCEEALGDHSTQLCAMSVVNASRISAGHVFQLKDSLCCREGDDLLMIPMNCMNISEKNLCTPLQLKMIAPIITNAVEETLGISYQMIREILSPFANDYALTDNILHDGRDIVKVERFGVPEDNVQFTHGVFTERKAIMGHEVFFLYTDRSQTLKNVSAVVFLEELERKKKEKMSMSRAEHRDFLSNWMTVHDIFLNTALGSEGGTAFKFLTGILVAPSTSKAGALSARCHSSRRSAHFLWEIYPIHGFRNDSQCQHVSIGLQNILWQRGQGELVTVLGFRQADASHHKHGGEDNNYRPRQRIHCSRKGDHSTRCSIHVLVSSS